ncbi:MAG TPA: transcriptional repressor LexA [Steroidobacteraceae bacterium]|nr:transcriptional repressor LexA [Steroidobacteraceae bacterium]
MPAPASSPSSPLSPKQLEVLDFIRAFIREHHSPPTRGEIAEGLGLKNRQGIDQHLRALETKGAIELISGISRGIRLREPALQSSSNAEDDTLPLLGRIAAGSPMLATGNIEERVRIDPSLFKPRADFLLRVRGDSMRDADILDRDLLAVNRTTQVRNGQIVVARLGDEATVKYYRREGSTVRLEPANPEFKPIEVDLHSKELTIEGLAVGVVRRELARIR